jgi:DNA-binding beta-propeller fold protein YncE
MKMVFVLLVILSLGIMGCSKEVGDVVEKKGGYIYAGVGHWVCKYDTEGNLIWKIGEQGTGEGQFMGVDVPSSVVCASYLLMAADKEGNLYVSDTLNRRVQKFDKDGNFLLEFRPKGIDKGGLTFGVDVDKDGNVYVVVVDDDGGGIQKFNKYGNHIKSFEGGGLDIAVDDKGNIYSVCEDMVIKYNRKGKISLRFGKKGSGDGEFDEAMGIEIDNEGNIYIADSGNARIQKFDSRGKFLMKFGKKAKLPEDPIAALKYEYKGGEFCAPTDVAVDNEGNIYVTDAFRRIQKFDSKGRFIKEFEPGIGWGIAFSPK